MDVGSLKQSFKRELNISEKDASELKNKFELKMINPPCPFCGAPFSNPLILDEKVRCSYCRNWFVAEDSAPRAIADILKENHEIPQQTIQKAQTIVKDYEISRRIKYQAEREILHKAFDNLKDMDYLDVIGSEYQESIKEKEGKFIALECLNGFQNNGNTIGMNKGKTAIRDIVRRIMAMEQKQGIQFKTNHLVSVPCVRIIKDLSLVPEMIRLRNNFFQNISKSTF